MSYQISQTCTSCQLCLLACPVGAIFDNGERMEVDEGECICCGACVEVCPNGSPYDRENPPLHWRRTS